MSKKWSVNRKRSNGRRMYGKVMVDPPGFSPVDRAVWNRDWLAAGGMSFKYGTGHKAVARTGLEAWRMAMDYADRMSRIIKVELR